MDSAGSCAAAEKHGVSGVLAFDGADECAMPGELSDGAAARDDERTLPRETAVDGTTGCVLPGKTADGVAAQKRAVRKEVLAKRAQMNAALRKQKSIDVCGRLEKLLVEALVQKEHPVVALYSAFGSELSLDALVPCAKDYGWQIAMPCMVSGLPISTGEKDVVALIRQAATSQAAEKPSATKPAAEMVFVRVSCEQALRRELPFLSKPASAVPACDVQELGVLGPSQIDAMIVPLVAFDAQGARLGYGGGNYDRYLPQLKPECFVVAVAFEEQRVEQLPRESFDCILEQLVFA